MTIRLVSDEKIAETSSKGNQEDDGMMPPTAGISWINSGMRHWLKP